MLEKEIGKILENSRDKVEVSKEGTIYVEGPLQDFSVKSLRQIRERKKTRFETLRKDNIVYVLSDIEAKHDEMVQRIGNQLINMFSAGTDIKKYNVPEGLDEAGGFLIRRQEFIKRGVENPCHPKGGEILSAMHHIDFPVYNVFYFWNIGKVKDVCDIDIHRGYFSDKFRKYYDNY